MAEHITTLNELREKMLAADPTDAPLQSDIVYAQRSTGSDRDKAFLVYEVGIVGAQSAWTDREGDLTLSTVQTSGGTKIYAVIKNLAVSAAKIANLLDFANKTIRWMTNVGAIMQIAFDGIKFFQKGTIDFDSEPEYRFDRRGNLRLGKLIMHYHSWNQPADAATGTEYRTMTNCEEHATSGGTGIANAMVTEYLSCPVQGSSKFTLNSTSHEEGSVVMVTNTGYYDGGSTTNPLLVHSALDANNPVAEIAAGASKLFIYRGLSNGTPVWRVFT